LAIWLGAQYHHPRITGSNVDKLQVVSRIDTDIGEIEWSPDGRRVALLGWEQPAEIREAKTLFHYRTLAANKKPIHFAFSPDETVFAYCENSSQVEILHTDTGIVQIIETGQPQPAMTFSADGRILGTGGYGTAASLWDVATGERIHSLDVGPTAGGLRVVFSPDGKTVAVGHRNANACLFDLSNGKKLHVLPKRMTHELEFDPKGERLAVAYVDGSVGLFDVASGKQLQLASSGAEEMYRVAWSPDGSLLVSAGKDGDIVVWNPTDMTVIRRLPAPEWVIGAKFTPDGTRLLTAGGARQRGAGKREVLIWAVPLWRMRWLGSGP
jgi:dipeptidyl aminopeptidase/acylaminoacyl peptidase